MIENIWKHPKTSIAGVLICAVTIAGVLSQQGITLGNAGSGTVVALGGALATALLGLLSKDPAAAGSASGSGGATTKISALLLLALLPVAMMPMTGCTASQLRETEGLVNVVIQAASNMAAVADPGATWVTEMPAAVKGLQMAEANFEAGTGLAADVSNAMLALEDVVAEVEPNSPVSDLADILTTALDAALALFPVPVTTAPAATASSTNPNFSAAAYHLRVARAKFDHHNRASIHHRLFRGRAGDFKAEWNKVVARKKTLAKAKL